MITDAKYICKLNRLKQPRQTHEFGFSLAKPQRTAGIAKPQKPPSTQCFCFVVDPNPHFPPFLPALDGYMGSFRITAWRSLRPLAPLRGLF